MEFLSSGPEAVLDLLRLQLSRGVQVGIPVLLNHDNDTLYYLSNLLIEHLNGVREKLARDVVVLFDENGAGCTVKTSVKTFYPDEPETLETLSALREKNQPFPPNLMKIFGYSDEEIINEMPIKADEQMTAIGATSRADCWALLAFHRNWFATELLQYVYKYQPDSEGLLGYQRLPFLESDKDLQVKNLILSFHTALFVDIYLQLAIGSHLGVEHTTEKIDILEDRAVEKAKLKEFRKAKAGADARHTENRKKEIKVLEVYLTRDYRERYREPGKKTQTALHILNRVNDWCDEEGIKRYGASPNAGVRTIKRIIDTYESDLCSR